MLGTLFCLFNLSRVHGITEEFIITSLLEKISDRQKFSHTARRLTVVTSSPTLKANDFIQNVKIYINSRITKANINNNFFTLPT